MEQKAESENSTQISWKSNEHLCFQQKQKSPAICPCPAHTHLHEHGLNLDCAELFSEMHQKVGTAQHSLITSALARELQSQPLDVFTSEVDT